MTSKNHGKTALFGFALFALSSCGQNYVLGVNSQGSNSASVAGSPASGNGGSSCTPFGASSAPLRILFMVDDSGSTTKTDPMNTQRVATVNTFLNNYSSLTNLSYSYGAFADSAVGYNMVSGGAFEPSPATPFGGPAQLSNALTAFQSLATGNPGLGGILGILFGVSSSSSTIGSSTNYTGAFKLLQNQILADQSANGTHYKYQVIFMSDGQPTDLGTTAASQLAGITTLMNSFMSAVGPTQVSVSSVFFGAPDPTSQTNIKTIATLGHGVAVDTNVTNTVTIADLVSVPGCTPN